MNKSIFYIIALFVLMAVVSAQTMNIVSDETTLYTYDEDLGWNNAVLAWVHPNWPVVGSGQWIWTSYHTSEEEAVNGTGASFKKIIVLPDDATNIQASITMDADNWFFLSLDNDFVGQNMDWQYPQTFDLNLHPGENVLYVFVMNTPLNNGNWETNPTGLVFSGQVTYDSEEEVPEFGVIAAGFALIGSIGIFLYRRKH